MFPETAGSIVRVFVENGDRVQKGSPLVEIRAAGMEAQLDQAQSSLEAARAELRQAEANLEQLESQYERNKTLGDQGLVPLDTVTTQRAQVEAARANFARARAQVSVAEAIVAERADFQRQTLIRAPITGRVGQRNAEVGMRVDTQTALFVIGRLERVRVEVPVAQDILTRIREGQRVELHVASERRTSIAARVSRISPFLAAGSYSAEVEIDVPNERGTLVPGMFVTVDIFYGESTRATLIPISALFEHPTTGEQGVFVTPTAPTPTGSDQPSEESPGRSLPPLDPPIPLAFRDIELVAEGPQIAGIRGVRRGEWVVVVGQHLLWTQPADNRLEARVRILEWDRILDMQQLQRHDLLRQFMERQQRHAGKRTGTASRAPDTASAAI